MFYRCQLNLNRAFGLKHDCNLSCHKNLKKSLALDYWIVVFVFGCGIFSSFWNFDFITIILWLFEFKQKIDHTVRPDKIDPQKNIYFEKLLHNKQDPFKMSTVMTNPISNNQNNQDLNQSKTNDSKAQKLYQQRFLEKKRDKESKKSQRLDQDMNAQLMDNGAQYPPQFNHLNLFNNPNIIQVLQNEFAMSNQGFPNLPIFPNGMNPGGFIPNAPENPNHNLPPNPAPMNMPNNENYLAKLNELRKREYESQGVSITHGMTQHSNKLINPFEEKRRPDSKSELTAPKPANELNENLQMISGNMAPNENPNPFGLQPNGLPNPNMNGFQLPPLFGQVPCPPMFHPGLLQYLPPPPANFQPNLPPQLNPFQPLFFPPANLMGLNLNQLNLHHQLMQTLNFKQLLDQQYVNGQILMNSKNINDLEAKKREIGETLHITQTVGSASDTNDRHVPIQIHDSDVSSMCSVDTFCSKTEDRNCVDNEAFKELRDKLGQVSGSEDEEGAKKEEV